MFEDSSDWKVGKILQFSYNKEKVKAAQQYRAKVTSAAKIGILCAWYSKSVDSNVHTYAPQVSGPSKDAHNYVPMSSYVCTLCTWMLSKH